MSFKKGFSFFDRVFSGYPLINIRLNEAMIDALNSRRNFSSFTAVISSNRNLSRLIITRGLSSHDNLTSVKPSNLKSFNQYSAKINFNKYWSTFTDSLKQKKIKIKRKIKFFVTAFVLIYLVVYGLLDHTIRNIMIQFLEEQNIHNYLPFKSDANDHKLGKKN
ncbi:hypothetical protein SSS_08460 [Sarcoptes scabiei]|nr:hypothetical protein SSS_08460 [Sarcoptes scabiei]UXI16246.1 methylmalonic aciduria type A protein [Sarcoptes scabiei]